MSVWLWVKRTATVTLTVFAIALVAWTLSRARAAVAITIASLLLAVALDRAVSWLERRGLHRALAIALVMLAVLGALTAVVLVLVPPAVGQVRELVQEAPTLLARIRESAPYRLVVEHLGVGRLLSDREEQLPGAARGLVHPALAIVTALLGGVAGVVTILVLTVFMLAFGQELVRSALAIARPERRSRYSDVLRQVQRALGGYITGLAVLVVTHAAFAGVFLAIIGVPYFLPLAVLSGLASVVPYVGTLAAGVVLSGVAWTTKGPGMAAATAIYYVAYHEFENHIIAPLVYRRTVRLNPLVILLAVLFMTELEGIPGALAAVPLAASLRIVLGEVLRARGQRASALAPRGPARDIARASVDPGEALDLPH